MNKKFYAGLLLTLSLASAASAAELSVWLFQCARANELGFVDHITVANVTDADSASYAIGEDHFLDIGIQALADSRLNISARLTQDNVGEVAAGEQNVDSRNYSRGQLGLCNTDQDTGRYVVQIAYKP